MLIHCKTQEKVNMKSYGKSKDLISLYFLSILINLDYVNLIKNLFILIVGKRKNPKPIPP